MQAATTVAPGASPVTIINMEFVTANPTGPLHIGHTRWAALGDAIGRVCSTRAGAKVTSEYYINDAGTCR